ncbi:SLC13 family permease [Maridesulfovibrio zosterae]|uniref:SLC13 family permease n=1 Tax=Maridesulfovibrio zosterae TaxID=82171 RepID=UPI00041EA7C1|nr:SLC13 family permease [Maridesulfovibrio zosterae]
MEFSTIYIYNRAPLVLLFATGYILYRVIATVGLPEYFASKAIRMSRGRADVLLLSLMIVSAALSMFIPNAVTVLAMLPVIRRLDSELESMTTPLTLSIIYGANIGGMGSLIGSPANLLLMGALDFFKVPGRSQITFINWFIWAIPLVIFFLLLAWLLLRFIVPKVLQLPEMSEGKYEVDSFKKTGLKLFALFMAYWTCSSILREFVPIYRDYEPMVAVFFTAVYLWLIFSNKVLRFRDLLQGVPLRGIIFLVLLGLLVVVVHMLNFDKTAARAFISVLSHMNVGVQSEYTLYLVTALVVITLTEFLSNTVVSTAFFGITVHVAATYSLNALPLMVLVSAASTCAFMTPVATPCNSLAVGEMRGISLRIMFVLGVVLNISGALLLSVWIWRVLPVIYS